MVHSHFGGTNWRQTHAPLYGKLQSTPAWQNQASRLMTGRVEELLAGPRQVKARQHGPPTTTTTTTTHTHLQLRAAPVHKAVSAQPILLPQPAHTAQQARDAAQRTVGWGEGGGMLGR